MRSPSGDKAGINWATVVTTLENNGQWHRQPSRSIFTRKKWYLLKRKRTTMAVTQFSLQTSWLISSQCKRNLPKDTASRFYFSQMKTIYSLTFWIYLNVFTKMQMCCIKKSKCWFINWPEAFSIIALIDQPYMFVLVTKYACEMSHLMDLLS